MTTMTPRTRKLTPEDILDLRAYERVREDMRVRVIETKRRRRISLGTIVTVAFENRETMRSQIHEMLRAEKAMDDAAVLEELRAYNPLIPEPGQLCATLFIELTSDAQMREWLPKLVGIERALVLRLADGSSVRAVVDEQHAEGLTREEVTAAVHYVRFEMTPSEVEAFARGGVRLECDLSNYLESVVLPDFTVEELLGDLRDDADAPRGG
ncbi:MAG: hypothetical protein RL283_1194 [Actinomycetota bacterium]